MLTRAKQALRISGGNNAFDDEIQELIGACKKDLQIAGVLSGKMDCPDRLIARAILTYVKAYFGWDNPDYEKLVNAYTSLKHHLLLSKEYTHVV